MYLLNANPRRLWAATEHKCIPYTKSDPVTIIRMYESGIPRDEIIVRSPRFFATTQKPKIYAMKKIYFLNMTPEKFQNMCTVTPDVGLAVAAWPQTLPGPLAVFMSTGFPILQDL